MDFDDPEPQNVNIFDGDDSNNQQINIKDGDDKKTDEDSKTNDDSTDPSSPDDGIQIQDRARPNVRSTQ